MKVVASQSPGFARGEPRLPRSVPKAQSFFDETRKREYKASTIAGWRAGYYTAVAKSLQKKGLSKKADSYLKMALEIQPKNKETLALKEKIKP